MRSITRPEQDNLFNVVTTIDGEKINKSEYDEVCMVLAKGLLHSDEVKEFRITKEEYQKLINHYAVKHVKKLYEEETGDKDKEIQRILQKEQEYSVKHFNKNRSCLNIKEHMEVIKALMPEGEYDTKYLEKLMVWSYRYSCPVYGLNMRYCK